VPPRALVAAPLRDHEAEIHATPAHDVLDRLAGPGAAVGYAVAAHEVGNLGERPLGQFMPHAAHDRGLLGHDHELRGVDEEARGVAQAAVAQRIVPPVPAVLAISRDVDRPWRSVPHIR